MCSVCGMHAYIVPLYYPNTFNHITNTNSIEQIHKIIGFAPSLLQVVILSDCDMPVRQAGAIYLKNLITQNWQERETEPGQPLPFALHEQDRALIRDSIVDAVVHAPDLIRTQLCICVHHIVKNDFPGRWTQIVDKVTILSF